MQGDIRPPKLKQLRPIVKPKPYETYNRLQPELNPAGLEPDSGSHTAKRLLVAPHKHFLKFWSWWLDLNRNERFAIIAVGLLVFSAASVLWIAFVWPSSTPAISITKHPKPKAIVPITKASPLSGLQVDPAVTGRPVTAVMIENSPAARPQSGLQAAGVVYEAIAEGGITRFLALFQDTRPPYIGPVRSLRPYYIDFAAPFQASIAHVGGSPDALSIVRNGQYRDLDQFFNSGSYWRIPTRASPHNVYTSFDRLDTLNQSKGYTSSLFTIWPRKADKISSTPTARTINIAISSPDYYSSYSYDKSTNSYFRSEGGAPHMQLESADDKTGVQLHPKVVIALVMAYNLGPDRQHSVYADNGSGSAFVFQDGGVTQGQWNKAGTNTQIQFQDASGAPLKLNAGQTWLTLIADSSKLQYAP